MQSLHTRFHQLVGSILALAYAGKVREAESSIEGGGEFLAASSQLTQAMIAWKDSLFARHESTDDTGASGRALRYSERRPVLTPAPRS